MLANTAPNTVRRYLTGIVGGAMLLGACTADPGPSFQEERRAQRQGAGSSFLCKPGSCMESCGTKSADGCWCDTLCVQYQDCCEDASEQCEALEDKVECIGDDDDDDEPKAEIDCKPGSCDKSCGSQSSDGCWCDALCLQYQDCCVDAPELCVENVGDVVCKGSDDPTGGGANAGTGGQGASGGGEGGQGGGVDEPTAAEETCERWLSDRADLDEGTWSGDINSCDVGDISPNGRANALKVVNLYRYLAGLPAVVTDPARDAKAQACALMQAANPGLSHSPPTTWDCYSSAGAEGAGSSNIATAAGVYAVDLYMADWGNEDTMGHRRWILSNSLGPMGLGSTPGGSCMWVFGSSNAGVPWVAWPPPGPVPVDALSGTDTVGWSFQSDVIDLVNADVTMKSGPQDLLISFNTLPMGYGAEQALRIVPHGWQAEAGKDYTVNITGIDPPISYVVEVIDCL